MLDYQLTIENRNIVWGTRIDIEPLIGKFDKNSIELHQENESLDWNLPNGVYLAKGMVKLALFPI